MPDFVDTVFYYTTNLLQQTSSVLNKGYAVSKDALQPYYDSSKDVLQLSYDTSKSVGNSIVDGAKKVTEKIQENTPTKLSSIVGLGIMNPSSSPPSPPPHNFYSNLTKYINNNNKLLASIFASLLAYGGYHLYRHYLPYERYAERLKGRVRYEVILVIGTINSTFVSKLVNDLNMRGYVVFVTVADEAELKIIEDINDPDVRPLFIDFTNESTVKNSLLKLGLFLDSRIDSLTDESYYNFKGVLAIPDYSKLPKIKRLEELNSREYTRVIDTFFLKINTIISNGVLSFLKESNSRRQTVENYNKQKLKGGFAKLLFINFMVVPTNDDRRLIHNLSLNMNKLFFDILYKNNAVTFKESIGRIFGKCLNPSLIDISSLNITLHRNNNSTLVNSSIVSTFLSHFTNTLTPRDIHHKVFDLLNQQALLKNYSIKN